VDGEAAVTFPPYFILRDRHVSRQIRATWKLSGRVVGHFISPVSSLTKGKDGCLLKEDESYLF